MTTKKAPVIAFEAPVEILAAETDGEGKPKGPRKFQSEFYTGGLLPISDFEHPVVVDLAGLSERKRLVATLDHDETKRVGNFSVANNGQTLVANGTASAATPARDEVVNSAADGYEWEASIEASAQEIEEVGAGKKATANGREFEGPVLIARKSKLSGFGFVTRGADEDTSVTIAASAASRKGITMNDDARKWIEAMGFDVDSLTEEQAVALEANYNGQHKKVDKEPEKLDDLLAKKKAERERIDGITEIAGKACDSRPYDIDGIKKLAEDAIEGKWEVDRFRLELLEASVPPAQGTFNIHSRDRNRITDKVLEAAICTTGRLAEVEKHYDDQTLQAAHDRFKSGVGLKQLMVLGAQANGYNGMAGFDVDLNVQRAAFGMTGQRTIQASGFSTLSLPNVFSNVANKFIREGWMAVDQTPMRISSIRPVTDFKQTTTVSLTGGFLFEQVGADGELKHATAGETVYNNQADTYGTMFAITRKDIINDDLGALTAVPRRLGRGGMLKLNDIFWTKFLNNSSFFTSGNSNVSTDTGLLSLLGLQEAETIFMNQTDEDGNPLGAQPAILLAPTALKSTALQLMTSEKIKGDADEPDGNVWRGRFRVESSPYMSNANYTGNSAAAWYMLADPNDIPVIEIAALFGRVEPTVETADAAFNVLGVQMRGYSDVGVELQEHRGGVRADGSAAD